MAQQLISDVGVAPSGTAALRRISWGAVIAGVVLALTVQLMLSILGVGIGLTTMDPLTESDPLGGIGLSAGIWWFISGMIAFYIGGWTSGRLAGMPRRAESAIHGVMVWSVATLLTFVMITTAIGRLIGGAAGMVGQTVSAAGQGLIASGPALAQGQGGIGEQIRDALGRGGQGQVDEASIERMERLLRGEGDRGAAVEELAQRSGMSRQEAAQTIDRWQRDSQRLRSELGAQGRRVADTAAEGVGQASVWAFLGLLIGAAAAAWGGAAGAPRAFPAR